jgi:hypothetical protein
MSAEEADLRLRHWLKLPYTLQGTSVNDLVRTYWLLYSDIKLPLLSFDGQCAKFNRLFNIETLHRKFYDAMDQQALYYLGSKIALPKKYRNLATDTRRIFKLYLGLPERQTTKELLDNITNEVLFQIQLSPPTAVTLKMVPNLDVPTFVFNIRAQLWLYRHHRKCTAKFIYRSGTNLRMVEIRLVVQRADVSQKARLAQGIMPTALSQYLPVDLLASYGMAVPHNLLWPDIIYKLNHCDIVILPVFLSYIADPPTIKYHYAFDAHANVLLFNKLTKRVEHYDPANIFIAWKVLLSHAIETLLKPFFALQKGWTLEYSDPYCPFTMGLQVLEMGHVGKASEVPQVGEYPGYCASWVLWYIDMRVKYPELPLDMFNKTLIRSVASKSTTVLPIIRRYSAKLEANVIETLKEWHITTPLAKIESGSKAAGQIMKKMPDFVL